MNVYFTASTDSDGQPLEQYKQIINYIKKQGHTLISGEQVIDVSKLKQDRTYTPQQIFQREKERIDISDCIVAEVTKPSSGVGGEIVYALIHDKPVLALFYKDSQNTLTPLIAGNPSDNLYLEHYEDDNIHIVLRNFFTHIEASKKRKGKLIVIDGGDGSGKATQSEMLIAYLKKSGNKVKYVDYPRYYTSFHGNVVARFLRGEFGKLDEVSPYLSALAYAVDRAGTKEELDDWLASGGIVISNRYATSSMAHQGAKMPHKKAYAIQIAKMCEAFVREGLDVELIVPKQKNFCVP